MDCPKCGKENTVSAKFCLACGTKLLAQTTTEKQITSEVQEGLGEASIGMKPNIAALLCYFLGFITGVIFYLVEKKNKFVRFNAIQSICLSICAIVLSVLLSSIPTLLALLHIAILVLWIVLMVKAYQGKYFKLPVIGNFAEKQSQ